MWGTLKQRAWPFRLQGQVWRKTIFPGGGGLGEQAELRLTLSPTLMSCLGGGGAGRGHGRDRRWSSGQHLVPDRLQTPKGPRPRGLGTPALKYRLCKERERGRAKSFLKNLNDAQYKKKLRLVNMNITSLQQTCIFPRFFHKNNLKFKIPIKLKNINISN